MLSLPMWEQLYVQLNKLDQLATGNNTKGNTAKKSLLC